MKMNKLFRNATLVLALGSVGFLWSCSEDEEPEVVPAPVAGFDFEVDNTTGVVTFTNTSTGDGNTYAWDFGDGNSSTDMSPTNTYAASGTYTVTLTATNEGGNDDETQDVTVTLPDSGSDFDGGLVVNGDFEAATAGNWFVNFPDAGNPSGNTVPVETVDDNTYFVVNVESGNAAQPFLVNLSQVISMTDGTVYKLTFKAKTDGTRSIIAGIGLYQDPWTAVTETVALTSDWQEFTYDLTATFTQANSRVLFDLAGEAGVVMLDDISLVAQP